MKVKHFGTVNENGKLELMNPDAFKSEISRYRTKRVYLTISENRPPRSNEQNSYYWGVVLVYLTETGYTVEEMHDLMKYMFLPKKEIMGAEIYGSTADLNSGEFEDYLAKIRMWAYDKLNIRIPLPNEIEYN